MADTVYTPDGMVHVVLSSTTRVSLIREYAGDDLADWAAEMQELAESYERSLYE